MHLSADEIARLADAYLLHAHSRAEQDFWAFDAVGDVVHGKEATPDSAWAMVQALIARVPPDDEVMIGYMAAGPVEDMVRYHGAALVDRIEQEAASNPHFRDHLAGVWLRSGDLPADAEARIVAASGGAIDPLPPHDESDDDDLVGGDA